VMNQQLGQPAPIDGVDEAAARTAAWGTKQRATGAGGQLFGKAEQAFGNVTGNPDRSDKGAVDEVSGAVKNAVGQVAQAAGKTLHDLNK
jgi:uncharacterized protein YjbJ (UPF0337 family)